MPQLDVTTYIPQLIWLAATFAFLYFVMSRFALPKVGEVMEERQARIDSDLEQAEKHREESAKLEQAYEELTASAKAEVVAFLKAEREKVHKKLDAKQGDMTSDLNGRVEAAEKRIAKAKEKAMADLEAIAAEACASIVGRLTGAKLNASDAKKAVRAARGGK